MMSENKPEWFQMADADRATQKASSSISRKRTVSLLALTAPIMILGAGLVIAQSTNVLDATAAAPITQVQSSVPAASDSANEISTSAVTNFPAPAVASEDQAENGPVQNNFQKISAPSVRTVATSAQATTPQGLVLPAVSASITNGNDDDESGDDDGDDDGDGESGDDD